MNIRLYLILCLALILRLYHLDIKPLNFDEKASLACALGIPFAGIGQVGSSDWSDLNINPNGFTPKDVEQYNHPLAVYRATLQDNGSILYFFTLHNWIKLFGVSQFSIRCLSLVFSLLTVCLVYFFALKLTASPTVSAISALVLAIHPLSIASAQFCRSHAMAGFFTLCASTVFLAIIQSQKLSIRNAFLYGLTCTAAMLCHYFAMYIFIGQAMVMLLLVRGRAQWREFALGGIIGVALFGMWLLLGGLEGLQIVSGVHERFLAQTKTWSAGDNPYYIPATLKNLLGGTVQVLLPLFGNYLQNFGFRLSQIVGLLAIPLLLIGYTFYQTRQMTRKHYALLLLGILVLAQPLWGIAISLKMGYMIFLQPIYAQYVAPYCAILLAMSFTQLVLDQKRKAGFVVLCLISLFIFLVSFGSVYINHDSAKSGEQIANEINKVVTNESVVVYSNWEQAFFTGIYLENKNARQKIIPDQGSSVLILGKSPNDKIEIKGVH